MLKRTYPRGFSTAGAWAYHQGPYTFFFLVEDGDWVISALGMGMGILRDSGLLVQRFPTRGQAQQALDTVLELYLDA